MAWVSITEAIQVLEISERTLYRRIKAGELSTRKEGGRVLVDIGAAEQRRTVAGTIRHLADVTTASAVQQAQQQQGLTRQLSDMREWRQELKIELDHARTETKRARRWSLAWGLVAMLVIFGGGVGFYEWTTRHRAALEGVRVELSDQRGRGVILGAQVRDGQQQLNATQAELSQAQATAGRLQAELTRLAAELAEAQQKAAGGLLNRLWRSLASGRFKDQGESVH